MRRYRKLGGDEEVTLLFTANARMPRRRERIVDETPFRTYPFLPSRQRLVRLRAVAAAFTCATRMKRNASLAPCPNSTCVACGP